LTSLALQITILVGKLVGGRLTSHAGSLINLARHPAATVQVLGVEEALFRVDKLSAALQNGQLIGQSNAKLEVKCRVSSLLAELMHLVSLLA
jgi:nucleolar protein 58